MKKFYNSGTISLKIHIGQHEVLGTYCMLSFNPLSGNPYTSIFENSEDPDEMQHIAAFHQGLYCL